MPRAAPPCNPNGRNPKGPDRRAHPLAGGQQLPGHGGGPLANQAPGGDPLADGALADGNQDGSLAKQRAPLNGGGNTVQGNTVGSNNTVNVTGNQATGYGYPYQTPVVIAPTVGGTSSAWSGGTSTASAAPCPAGTTMQSVTTSAQGQTTIVCVAAGKQGASLRRRREATRTDATRLSSPRARVSGGTRPEF